MKPSRASALYGASSPSYKCSSYTASATTLTGQHYIAKTRSIACALFCMQPNHCHRQACWAHQDEKGKIGEYLTKTQFTGTCHHVTCGQIHPGVLHGLQPQMMHIRSGNLALEMQFIENQTQNGPCISTRPAVFGAGGRNRTRDPLITSQLDDSARTGGAVLPMLRNRRVRPPLRTASTLGRESRLRSSHPATSASHRWVRLPFSSAIRKPRQATKNQPRPKPYHDSSQVN